MSESIAKLCRFQIAYILMEAAILVVEKSRQIGFTWTSGYRVVRRIMRSKTAQNHYWLSRDELTAKAFLQDVLQWLIVFNIVAESELVDMKGVQATKIIFPNGCVLFILTSSVDAVVGKRGHFYLDEYALHRDQEQLWNIVLPCITWGYTLTVISTHRSKQTFFYRLCQKIRDGQIPEAQLMSIDIEKALDDGLLDAMNVRRQLAGQEPLTREEFTEGIKKKASSEAMYLQEYMCKPADADQVQAVSEEALQHCVFPQNKIGRSAPESGAKYFAGVDIGRMRDLTVIAIFELVEEGGNPIMILRHMKTIQYTEFTRQESMIYTEIKKWRPYACYIDGTNQGAQIAETMEKRLSYCKSIRITRITRPKIIGEIANFVDKRFIRLFDSQELWADFLSVERYINKHGDLDYFIPSRGAGGVQGHGDRFMACGLALFAAMSKNNRIGRKLQDLGVTKDNINSDEKKKRISEIGRVIKQRKRFRI